MTHHPPKHSPREAQRNWAIEILSNAAPKVVRMSVIVEQVPWSAATMWHVMRDLEQDGFAWRSADRDPLWGLL